jgi:hypothetical protein
MKTGLASLHKDIHKKETLRHKKTIKNRHVNGEKL